MLTKFSINFWKKLIKIQTIKKFLKLKLKKKSPQKVAFYFKKFYFKKLFLKQNLRFFVIEFENKTKLKIALPWL